MLEGKEVGEAANRISHVRAHDSCNRPLTTLPIK